MTRTGNFRYVRHDKVDAMHRIGWMVVAHLGPTHGQWSVLMWRCDCPEEERPPEGGRPTRQSVGDHALVPK